MIIDIPIESFESRYSADWQRWFSKEYERLDIEFIRIDPKTLTDKIEVGSFLDVVGTHYYKAAQVQEICRLIHLKSLAKRDDEDIFFFHDLWHPGVETLAYIRDGMGLNFKIAGCLHAGSYDPHDFLARCGMQYWAEDVENGWFKIVDVIFVATEFHKRLILETRKCDPNKIHVTGFPIYYEQSHLPKENIVVFPHRLDKEKNPHIFDKLRETFSKKNWQFIRSKDVCQTKKEYYDLLERSKISVSTADQETWGIAMQESLFANCLVAVPNRLSYVEMYDLVFQYAGFSELVDLIEKLTSNGFGEYYQKTMRKNRDELALRGSKAIENMMEVLHA